MILTPLKSLETTQLAPLLIKVSSLGFSQPTRMKGCRQDPLIRRIYNPDRLGYRVLNTISGLSCPHTDPHKTFTLIEPSSFFQFQPRSLNTQGTALGGSWAFLWGAGHPGLLQTARMAATAQLLLGSSGHLAGLSMHTAENATKSMKRNSSAHSRQILRSFF